MTIINGMYIHDKYGFKTDSQLVAEHRFKDIFCDLDVNEQKRLRDIMSDIETVITFL